jgi:hypothetical protein
MSGTAQNPRFKPLKASLNELCNYNKDKKFKISLERHGQNTNNLALNQSEDNYIETSINECAQKFQKDKRFEGVKIEKSFFGLQKFELT